MPDFANVLPPIFQRRQARVPKQKKAEFTERQLLTEEMLPFFKAQIPALQQLETQLESTKAKLNSQNFIARFLLRGSIANTDTAIRALQKAKISVQGLTKDIQGNKTFAEVSPSFKSTVEDLDAVFKTLNSNLSNMNKRLEGLLPREKQAEFLATTEKIAAPSKDLSRAASELTQHLSTKKDLKVTSSLLTTLRDAEKRYVLSVTALEPYVDQAKPNNEVDRRIVAEFIKPFVPTIAKICLELAQSIERLIR